MAQRFSAFPIVRKIAIRLSRSAAELCRYYMSVKDVKDAADSVIGLAD